MRTLLFLLKKEFRQIFRNPTILRMIIIMPLAQLIILPLAADFEIKNINVSVVDHDRSTYSRLLISKLQASDYFRINDYGTSFDYGFEQFQKNKSDIILEIPKNFEKDLVKEKQSDLFLAVNAINGMKAGIGSSYLNQIIRDFNSEIRLKWSNVHSPTKAPILEIAPLNWFNPLLKYTFYMVPGILAFMVTMIGVFMAALNIVKEKEVGTIEQINVTPIKKYQFILGKLIPFWLIGVFVFTIGLFAIGRLLYNIIPVGSVALLYGFLAVFLVAVLGIGLLISTYSNTQQQAMSLAFFCMMIFILMSGLFTPIDSMPTWAQWLVKLNPVSYFVEVVRMIILKGSGFSDIKSHFLVISAMAIFFNGWAIFNYKKTS